LRPSVDGFNLVYSVTPGTFVDFIDGVVPCCRHAAWCSGNMLLARGGKRSSARPGCRRVILPQPTAAAKTRRSGEGMKALLNV
jgi:hypothetical protein